MLVIVVIVVVYVCFCKKKILWFEILWLLELLGIPDLQGLVVYACYSGYHVDILYLVQQIILGVKQYGYIGYYGYYAKEETPLGPLKLLAMPYFQGLQGFAGYSGYHGYLVYYEEKYSTWVQIIW